MGNICNNGHLEKEETTETVDTFNKNYPICEFTVRKTCKIGLVLGTYRYHRSETLLVLMQPEYLEYSPEIREYAQNFSNVLEQVNVERRRLFFFSVSRNCPFKKAQICILPAYSSLESEAYLQNFQSMLQQIINQNSQITLQLSYTSENQNGLPNQTLIAVFLRYLSTSCNKPLKISVISNEAKLLNMVRYEITKLDNFVLNSFNSDFQI